jgi:hypothetical protein
MIPDSNNPPSFIFGDPEYCTYCGVPANCLDHVIPVSSYKNIAAEQRRGGEDLGLRTHSCQECNRFLGAKVFPTFYDRLIFSGERILKESKKFKRDASWTDEEIAELDDTLRSFVANRQLAMRQLDAQATWLNSSGFWKCMSTLYKQPSVDKTSDKFKPWVYDYFNHYL